MTVLDTPEERQTVFPVSVEFYHEAGRLGMIGEDVELLDGVIFKKMPKSPLHEWFIACLRRLLEAACGPGMFVEKERPITCRSSSSCVSVSWQFWMRNKLDSSSAVNTAASWSGVRKCIGISSVPSAGGGGGGRQAGRGVVAETRYGY